MPNNGVDEIERRFLLKRRPYFPEWDHIYDIAQYYIKSGDIIKRLRSSMDITPSKNLDDQYPITYEFLHKEPVSKGHFIEVPEPFEVSEVPALMKQAFKYVTKTRFIHVANGLKFEIDKLEGIRLEVMEVELKSIDQGIIFPKAIEDLIIAEITGLKGFSNFDLARPVPQI